MIAPSRPRSNLDNVLHSCPVNEEELGQRRTALVTGGARRLGKEIAVCLAQAGFSVFITYRRSESQALDTLAELQLLGSEGDAIQADLARQVDRDRLVDLMLNVCSGGPTVLVNSAMDYPRDNWRSATQEAVLSSIALGSVAPLDLSRKLMSDVQGGVVVNMLDARIHDYDRNHLSYSSAKKLLLDYTKILATELAPSVRVNALAPGFVLPPEDLPPDTIRRVETGNPLRRRPAVQEVLDGLLYLVNAASVTGQVLYIDGGRHLTHRLQHHTTDRGGTSFQ